MSTTCKVLAGVLPVGVTRRPMVIFPRGAPQGQQPAARTRRLRLLQIHDDAKATPLSCHFPGQENNLVPGIQDGRFPESIKLSESMAVWRVVDIRALVEAWEKSPRSLFAETNIAPSSS